MESSSSFCRPRLRARELTLCALFCALCAAGAFIRIPLPVISFTLQTLFVTLAGLLLGRRLGALSIAAYVTIGLLGVPIFTGGGGISYLVHPTFGFLLGFIPGAWLTGFLSESLEKRQTGKRPPALSRKNRRPDRQSSLFYSYFLAGLGGAGLIYLIGVPYFYLVMNYYLNSPMGIAATLINCFLLTLPGDFLKLCLAAWLACRLSPRLRKF